MVTICVYLIGLIGGFATGVYATLAICHGAMADHFRRGVATMENEGRMLTREDVDASIDIFRDEMSAVRLRDAAGVIIGVER